MSEFKAEPSLSENHRKHEQQTLTNYTTNSDEFEGMYSLKTVVGNTTEYEMFKLFLQNNNAFFDIQCWMDIEAYSYVFFFVSTNNLIRSILLLKLNWECVIQGK